MLHRKPALRRLAHALALAGLCFAAASSAHADTQDERVKALEKKLEASLARIDAMAARVAELERMQAAAVAPAAPAAAATASATAQQDKNIAELQENVSQLSESLAKRSTDTGLPLHGFADVDAAWSRNDDPQKLRGFSAGTLDLYLTPQFGDRVKSLIELAVEYDPDGTVGLDMERLQIGYTASDALTFWAGRFHTPIGLWNTSFHHGANLQTSIYRPRFVDFEDKGGIVAAHSVGLWASGKTALGDGKLSYDAYLANGSSIRDRTLDFNPFTDDTSNKLVGVNVGFSPAGALSGLKVGVHGFASKVDALNDGNVVMSRTDLRMAGGYFGYDADDWEVIGEFYGFRNVDVATGLHHASNAWFTQVGKTFGQWTPFVRYERAALDGGDNYFASQATGRSYQRASVGMRYAIDQRSSFKVELGHTHESQTTLIDGAGGSVPFQATSYDRASLQYSIAF